MIASINLPVTAAFVLLVTYAAITDVKGLKIANWISMALIALFIFYIIAGKFGFDAKPLDIMKHVLVAAAVLVTSFALFAFGAMGAGDAKLITAVSLWAGPVKILPFIGAMALAGGCLALIILAGTFFLGWDGSGAAPNRFSRLVPSWIRKGVVPYGVAICIGALTSIPSLLL